VERRRRRREGCISTGLSDGLYSVCSAHCDVTPVWHCPFTQELCRERSVAFCVNSQLYQGSSIQDRAELTVRLF
jgi:hypothetical protein